jgi:hypothetical protein
MKKYIQDDLLLTKEAFEEYILKQRQAESTSYGLTLEQYQQAVLSGSCVQSTPPTKY